MNSFGRYMAVDKDLVFVRRPERDRPQPAVGEDLSEVVLVESVRTTATGEWVMFHALRLLAGRLPRFLDDTNHGLPCSTFTTPTWRTDYFDARYIPLSESGIELEFVSKTEGDLIEKMARVLYGLNPEIQPWDGDPYGFDEPRARYARDLAYKQARAVAEVLAARDTVPGQTVPGDTQPEKMQGVTDGR